MTAALRMLLAALACLLALPALAAFTDNNDGTVTDTLTGLMWDKCSWGQTWTSGTNTCSSSADASLLNWAAAMGVAVTANNTTTYTPNGYKGYSDWRLPNIKELDSLLKLDASNPAIDATAFPNSALYFWSSTVSTQDPARAWPVYFNDGGSASAVKINTNNVRLVRSGQSFNSFDAMVDPPVFVSATANGSTLVMTYTETTTLDAANIPAASAFTVKVNAVAQASPTNVVVSAAGKTVTLTLAAAVVSGDVVTVSYTNPTAGDDANAIQDAAGNDAATITNQAVTNITPDVAVPVFYSATANGSTLVMTYTEANTLDATNIPAASAFTVKVNAVAQASPTNVVVSAAGKTVTLTLAAAVVNGDAVTVSYTDPTAGDDANAIQDAAGNDAATISNQAVTNNTADVTAPVFASATANGSTLVMTYTEANTLHATNKPDLWLFTVKVNAVAQASPTNVVVSAAGKTVTLTLAAAVAYGDVVTVSYRDAAPGNDAYAIQDAAGNDAATITDQAVTNNTPDVTVPVFASATVSGSTLVMTYTEANTLHATNIPAASAFTVNVNAVAQASPTNVVVSAAGKTVTLTLAAAVVNGDAVTVSYTDPTTGDDANAIQDAAGNDAATITDQAVTNNTPDTTAPTLSSVGVSGTTITGTTLAATSNEAATGYWIVVARAATAPSAAQVKAAATYSGVSIVASGNGSMTANTAKSFSVAGLTAGTDYDLYFAAEDASNNLVASPTQVQFFTLDTTPDAFSFADQIGVALSTQITSAAITVTGINSAATISIIGGEYEVNGSGTWASATGSVTNNQTVKVRHSSSGSYMTAIDTTLTIGGVADTFSTTTQAEPSAPSEVRISGAGQSVTAVPGLPLRVAAGMDVEGATITFPANAAITVELGGASFVVTGLSAATRLGLKTLMVNGVATVALYLVEGSARVAASGAGATMVVLADGATQVISGADGADLGVTLNGGETVLFVRRGFVTLPGVTRSGQEPHRAATAEFRVYAGERVTLNAAGRVATHVLGNESGDGAGDPLTLDLPANLTLAAPVPSLDAHAERLGKTVQQALADAAGATLVYGQTRGVLALELDGRRVYALPQGAVPVDTARADGVSIEANGLAAVTMRGITVRLAPSVAYPHYLAEDVAAALPGATLTVSADGVYLAKAGDLRYALRPDWFAPVAVSRPAGFAAADGRIDYVRNFRAYTLYPAFADFARLASVLTEALPGATATTNADGTVSVVSGEQRWTLAPEMAATTAPAGAQLWWVETDGTLRLRYADETMQGVRTE